MDEYQTASHPDENGPIGYQDFLSLCRMMAKQAGLGMRLNEHAILFDGVIEGVDLRFTVVDNLVSVRSREFCPGYDGSPDERAFVVETILDHIGIAKGEHREGPDWRDVLNGEERG